jgi:hypothetical protein
MKTSSKPKPGVQSNVNRNTTRGAKRATLASFPRAGTAALGALGLATLLIAQTPALASPGVFEPLSAPSGTKLNLGLDSRAAGRLLAESKPEGAGGVTDDEKPKSPEKSDEVKLTVLKGSDAKRPAEPSSSGDSFAFVKDWPFWVIVGGVVVAGAATYMIVRNSNQGHACLADTYNAGCFGAK